ncbi:hypothetical protein M4H60_002421 [Listeria monocytogenes]|nr:hypothetical protein [Listeria monocytogenes]
MNLYEYKEVVEQVQGLNSISSLKRWRKLAEDRANICFKQSLKPNGRRSKVSVYLFTDKDIVNFQQVANKKDRIGLENAILQAFLNKTEPSLQEHFDKLLLYVQELQSTVNGTVRTIQLLESQVQLLQKKVETFEEQPKGIFRRKKER